MWCINLVSNGESGMKIVVMNSILYVFMLMIINMLIVGDFFCFQAQASVKRCLQLSVYRKMELNKKD